MTVPDIRAKTIAMVNALECLDREDRLAELDHELIQRPLRLLVKAYLARKRAECEATGQSDLTPFGDDGTVTSTEVAVLCADMLEAADMDTFELDMWRSLGRF